MIDDDSLPDDMPDDIKEIIRRISEGDFPDELPGNLDDYLSSGAILTSSGIGAPMPQLAEQPDGAELLKDVAPAEWVAERLWDTHSVEGTPVGCVIPEGFDAYARIFHPAEYQSGDKKWHNVSWATVADWYGKVVHPQMNFSLLANLDRVKYDSPSWGSSPSVGGLPEDECRHLAGVLEEFTSTPERCYSGVWHGYADLSNPFHSKCPTLVIPNADREYFIFCGPLDGVMSFFEWISYQSPNLWWPEDNSWFVATEIDFTTTYVGGSAACIERVLAHPELEALPIAIDARVDAYGDTING